ncbi:hypothetical protein DSECCO2_637960 [anaerobic digester metagenome]
MRNTKHDVEMIRLLRIKFRFAYVTPSAYVEINNSGKDLEMCVSGDVEILDCHFYLYTFIFCLKRMWKCGT